MCKLLRMLNLLTQKVTQEILLSPPRWDKNNVYPIDIPSFNLDFLFNIINDKFYGTPNIFECTDTLIF